MEAMEQRAEEYVKLFEAMRERVGSDEVAVQLVDQVGKDLRVAAMRGNGNDAGAVARDSSSATQKQLGYLKSLGVEVSSALTRERASQLIDEALGSGR